MTRIPNTLTLRITVESDQFARTLDGMTDESNRAQLLDDWARIYWRSMQSRYNLMSGGGWHKLSDRAKASKIKAVRGRDAILFDTGAMYGATKPTRGTPPPGQVRLYNTRDMILTTGVGGSAMHPRPADNKRRFTIGQMYVLHNDTRMVLTSPNANVVNKIETSSSVWYRKIFRFQGGR